MKCRNCTHVHPEGSRCGVAVVDTVTQDYYRCGCMGEKMLGVPPTPSARELDEMFDDLDRSKGRQT